ncbi:ABC transporter substrate-binding protein [Rhizobium rhizogenes]|uniref:ABC transporter substrate-binding protein n=1 Tax=Rhizobium rhizogenes TaxID=359 RepID=UPI0015745E0F|nr:ABC transporter substrate-binding protein [Rhizobium rhizogenes]NTH22962.1 carbohydrate ABC transporter substrate-binding protein [Rhizobium rhizogenes]NTH35992.1 carbohydrate ABC transporter substrate-binding protein [Rhizobium rhizogenes]
MSGNHPMHASRRSFLKKSVVAAAATQLGSFGTLFPTQALASQFAPGMTGGPFGFDGAERFQYNGDMSEGRAIAAIKELQASGKAPKKIRFLIPDGSIDQVSKPFKEGATSPLEVWTRETGIEIEMIGAPVGDIFKKVMQDVTTGDGSYDIYTGPWNSTGDIVASGGALDCTAFVDKYKPDWGDPKRGMQTEALVKLLYTYNNKNYQIALDGDFLTWYYLRGLYEKPQVQEAFMKEVGRELVVPNTWQEMDEIAKFFTGKDFGSGTMYGNGCLMSRFWGLPTFHMRLASMALPNYHFFDEDGNPNLDTDLAAQAAEEHVRSLEWSPPDALNFTFVEGWSSMWNMQVPNIATYTAIAKFGDGIKPDGTPKSKATGQLDCHLPLGRKFGDKINRRSILHYSISAWISSKSQNAEAAYLFLQWLSSTRTFTLMMASPTGYFDPMQQANFNDPLVAANYRPYAMEAIPNTIARSVPGINFGGQTALDNALDEEVQAALTKQKTPREAMKAAQGKWEKIIKRQGGRGIVEAIKASRSTWPTIVDPA